MAAILVKMWAKDSFRTWGLYPITKSARLSQWLTSQNYEQRDFDAKPDFGPFLSPAQLSLSAFPFVWTDLIHDVRTVGEHQNCKADSGHWAEGPSEPNV